MAVLALSISACALTGNIVDHSFEFNAKWDSPDIEVLDYGYSTRKPEVWYYREGHVNQATSITGGFPPR